MDHLGYRKKFGALGPSTNTIVQPDFDDLRPVGVTNHYSRIIIPNNPVSDNEGFLKLVDSINGATLDAVDVLKSCEMDYMVMGMSAATFWNGRAGAERIDDAANDEEDRQYRCRDKVCSMVLENRKYDAQMQE